MAASTCVPQPDYHSWEIPDLVRRVQELEALLKGQDQQRRRPSPPLEPKPKKKFNASQYTTRFVALKFAYLGHNYGGLEYHKNGDTPLRTVEEELWKALVKAKLVNPPHDPGKGNTGPNWEGLEYSKCGRTDRGVSAFGQVVALRVRSNRRRASESHGFVNGHDNTADGTQKGSATISRGDTEVHSTEEADPTESDFDPIKDELPYLTILNRLLPPDIRILAWCPSPPPDFSARFSCKERRYKYFFTNPAFSPTPSSHSATSLSPEEGYLNIPAMQRAAKEIEGLHDFRNFCKVDASKQLDHFQRRIFHASITEVPTSEQPAAALLSPSTLTPLSLPSTLSSSPTHFRSSSGWPGSPSLYVCTIHGSAFLWHQIRHLVAILFLVGQGLEDPSIIPALLDTNANPRKPHYDMADDRPLVLWDCLFPETQEEFAKESRADGLEWVYAGDEVTRDEAAGREKGGKEGKAGERVKKGGGGGRKGAKDSKFATHGLIPSLWTVWRERKMDEVLAGALLNVAVRQGRSAFQTPPPHSGEPVNEGDSLEMGKKPGAVEQRGDVDRCEREKGRGAQKVFLGGDTPKLVGKYVPLLERPRMDTVEEINARWVQREERKAEREREASESEEKKRIE